MPEGGVSPEESSSAPDQPKYGFREAIKKVWGSFRRSRSNENMAVENSTDDQSYKEVKSVPPEIGYADLIKKLSASEDLEMNTAVVNELITLYPEFIKLLEGNEVTYDVEEKKRVGDALEKGNKDIIAALAQRFIRVKLNRDAIVKSDILSARGDTKKAVLANYLIGHMKKMVTQEERREIDLTQIIFKNDWEALLPKAQQSTEEIAEINGVPITVRQGLLDVPFFTDGSPK